MKPTSELEVAVVLSNLKDVTDPRLDPLEFDYQGKRAVEDEVNVRLHHILC